MTSTRPLRLYRLRRRHPTIYPAMQLVDLAKHPDDDALDHFYHNLIVPAFPNLDELDDLEDWQIGLSLHRKDKHPKDPELHIIIAYEDNDAPDIADGEGSAKDAMPTLAQLGGAVYEWYPGPQGGTALLSYLVTSPHHRKRGVATTLIAHLAGVLSDQGVRVLIAETHKMLVADGTDMDPKQRHVAFHRLGFAPVQMRYAQPPVRADNSHSDDLLLIAHCGLLKSDACWRETLSTGDHNDSGDGGGTKVRRDECATSASPMVDASNLTIPSQMLQSYIDGFCGSVFGFDERHLFEKSAWYLDMAQQLAATPLIRVLNTLSPPWKDSVCDA